jgi:3-hydroxyisobutyrate dehydrogenase-like beta-hydroxyacid dehydrogenase
VARQAELLLLSLPSAAALRQVVGELAEAPPPQPGQIVVETSTLPLADKRWAAAELKRQGRVMLDAPISGTATPTPEAVWIMYVSGPVAACRKAAAVAQAFTLSAPRVGPLGHGIKLKIAANHLVGLMNVACAEMVTLCRAMGLDPEIALRHMGHSPYIGTGLMRLRMPMMIQGQYEPATMKLASDTLRGVLATTHIALRDVPAAVTREALLQAASATREGLRHDFGIAAPKLALCALNPHAGDSGRFGHEDDDLLAPVAREAGMAGPFPADTVFVRAMRGEFDAVIAPYHDVGMTAIKVASFGSAVNVTLGLPFVRTSPDHGTALDIAGQGVASPESLIAAMRLAVDIVDRRRVA